MYPLLSLRGADDPMALVMTLGHCRVLQSSDSSRKVNSCAAWDYRLVDISFYTKHISPLQNQSFFKQVGDNSPKKFGWVGTIKCPCSPKDTEMILWWIFFSLGCFLQLSEKSPSVMRLLAPCECSLPESVCAEDHVKSVHVKEEKVKAMWSLDNQCREPTVLHPGLLTEPLLPKQLND